MVRHVLDVDFDGWGGGGWLHNINPTLALK